MNLTTHYKALAPTTILVSILLTAVIGLLDHVTGYELGFFVFYFVPVSYATWFSGRVSGCIVSVGCAMVWFFVDTTSGHPYSLPWYGLWNGSIRLFSFLLITIMISKVRELLTAEKELSTQLQESLDQVRELRGLLPICAACKKIRNDEGYWEQIELYIRRHSKAEFSHGICPECAKRLYPEYVDMET